MPSIWKNFNHVFEVFQGLFFAFLLWRKDSLETGLGEEVCGKSWSNLLAITVTAKDVIRTLLNIYDGAFVKIINF